MITIICHNSIFDTEGEKSLHSWTGGAMSSYVDSLDEYCVGISGALEITTGLPHYRPMDGETVLVIAGLGIAIPILGSIALSIGFSILGIAVQAALEPEPGDSRLDEVVAAPQFEGPKTFVSVGQEVALVYGELAIGGSVIQQDEIFSVEFPNDGGVTAVPKFGLVDRQRSKIKTRQLLCHGPIEDVTQVKLNNIDIDTLNGANWTFRRGVAADNSAFKEFDVSQQEQVHNALVEVGAPIEVVTVNVVDELVLVVTFPLGMWFSVTVPVSGNIRSNIENFVDFMVQYRRLGDPSYITLLDTTRFSARSFDLVEMRVQFPKLRRSIYQIKLTRVGPTIATPPLFENDYTFPQLSPVGGPYATALYEGRSEMRLGSLIEIIHGDRLHPGFAQLVVTQDAQDKLNEIPRSISCTVKGFNDIRIYSDLTTFDVGWTDNPAWIFAHFVTSSQFGLGRYFDYDSIDIQSFLDWSTFCDVLVDDGSGGSEKRCLFDHLLANPAPVLQIAEMIARAGRAMITNQGNRWFAIPDEARSRTTIFFESSTLSELELRWIPLEEIPTRVTADFLNKDRDGFRDIFTVFRDDVNNIDFQHDSSITMFGVTRASQISRDLKVFVERLKLEDHEVTFEVGIHGRSVSPGDVFGLSMPSFGLGTVDGLVTRVDSPVTNWVEIDKDVTLAVGPTQTIIIRHTDDTTSSAVLTAVGASTFRFTAVDPNDFINVVAGDQFAIGTIQDYVCREVSERSDYTFHIKGRKYDPAVYAFTQVTPDIAPFEKQLNSSAAPGPVRDLGSKVDTAEQVISLTWSPPLVAFARNYYVAFRSLGNVQWILHESTEALSSVLPYGHDSGKTIEITVTAASEDGAQLDVDQAAGISVIIP